MNENQIVNNNGKSNGIEKQRKCEILWVAIEILTKWFLLRSTGLYFFRRRKYKSMNTYNQKSQQLFCKSCTHFFVVKENISIVWWKYGSHMNQMNKINNMSKHTDDYKSKFFDCFFFRFFLMLFSFDLFNLQNRKQ